MTIADAFKLFVRTLVGKEAVGTTIADVIRDAADKMSTELVSYKDDGKAVILKSSTAGSQKQFKITVEDDGTLTATEVA